MENVCVVPEQEKPDGDFPTVKVPNPEDPGAFALALKMQTELEADLCVATDPDCDRVGVACMTENGRRGLLNGNQIGCVLLHYILSQKKERGDAAGQRRRRDQSIVSTDMARAICRVLRLRDCSRCSRASSSSPSRFTCLRTTGAHTLHVRLRGVLRLSSPAPTCATRTA